ncbi:TetR/AcrR family transcriptional regulator [Antrihabitans cavernicola]|uniref:TetR/AcrR family transcriptional regulator n=1 Tax=Antrihabitans cavernicola TaxID=2495913 RepID=A0A5A7S6G2_9NOCA|nr:TetR/AcrR family transcriptional regulator [Spelaeibacter cavernicola]KAA0019476.1 TetR/AcrR family transcriptional regulator [Spelaeibacter cavernicola]
MAAATNTAELLWGPPNRPKRGPKPALSLDRILETAIALADSDGLASLSMQKLAEELGFTKMSLYRYTPGRAELTALMLDVALGAPPDLSPTHGWRSKLHALATQLHHLSAHHPWSLEIAVGTRIFGPNELGWLESGLAALAGTGLTGGEKLDAIVLVFGHVRALVQQTASTPGGGSEQDLNAVMAGVLAENAHTYPEVLAAFSAAGAAAEFDNALEFGLARIFDGLAMLIAERN